MSDTVPVRAATDTPQPRADLLVGRVLDGKFRLERVLAKGGSGRVYLATQVNLDRDVAIKVMRPDVESEDAVRFEERFFREASLAGQLNHPHVVTVHDYGRGADGVCFLAMELLAGRSLKDRMKEGPLPPEEALPIFEQVVRGLRHAHRAGLVHRDMKPGNVQLVPGEDGHAFAKILDFGLVRLEDTNSEITREGYFVGTPHYSAPEQVMAKPVDGRADLYSVGVMLYRALCGRLPYWSKDGMAIALSHCQDPYPPMKERAPGVEVPAELEAIVQRCMKKRPEDRYPDASALLQDLRAARRFFCPTLSGNDESSLSLSGAQVEAEEPTVEDPVRVNGLLTAAVAFLVVVVGVGVAAWNLEGPQGLAPMPVAQPAPVLESDPVAILAEDGPDATPAVRDVAVVITSVPSGAEVLAGTVVLGSTPFAEEIEVAEAGALAVRSFVVRKAGYRESVVELDVSGALAKAEVALRRRPAPALNGPASAAPAAPVPPAAVSASAEPKPVAQPAAGAVLVDGVRFSAEEAAATLAFVNTADKNALLRAGMVARSANLTLANRPFASIEAYGALRNIGVKTVEAARRGAAR